MASLSAETASLYYGHKMTLSQANDIAEDWLSHRSMHSIDKAVVVETAMLVRDRFFTLIHFPPHVFRTVHISDTFVRSHINCNVWKPSKFILLKLS